MFNPLTDYVDDENRKQKDADPFGRLSQSKKDEDREIAELGDPSALKRSVGTTGKNERRDVAKAETLLGAAGELDLKKTDGPTGYWGLRTEDATKTFQKKHGLKVDGLMNPGGETVRTLAKVALGSLSEAGGQALKALAQPKGTNSGVALAPGLRPGQAPTGAQGSVPAGRSAKLDAGLRQHDGSGKRHALSDEAFASNRRTADALGKIKGVGDMPRFTIDAINTNGNKAVHEVADLIGQVHARSPEQALELLARTRDGIGAAQHAAFDEVMGQTLGGQKVEMHPLELSLTSPETDGSETMSMSNNLPPAQARKEARETVADRRTPVADVEHAARINLTGTPQEVKDNLSSLSQKYRAEGYTRAADSLDHFLNGKGKPLTVSRDDARKDPFVRDAELENQKRFETRTFLGKTDNRTDINNSLQNLKDGETVRWQDDWDVEKGKGGLAADAFLQGKAGMDDILADGERNFKSVANFTATRRGDKIHISGKTEHDGTENYDFETDGLGHLMGAKGLAEAGLGDNFEITRKWDQFFEGTVDVMHTQNGVELTNPRFNWRDTMRNHTKP